MRSNAVLGWICVLGSALIFASCEGLAPSSPSSPSAVPTLTTAGNDGERIRPLEDPPAAETPAPAPGAPPGSGEPAMPPPPPPPPAQVIGIVGSFGTTAFAPNPVQAAVGDMIVWTNNDVVPHNIVLDDGTVAGMVGPGQSTPPLALTTPTAVYRCTIHPSMVGSVGAELTPTPPPPPPPVPPYSPPGYYDDYGTRSVR